MHSSNVPKHLQSWKATFTQLVKAGKARHFSKVDRDSLIEAMTIFIAICFDIVSRNSSSDAAGALFSNLKSVVRAERELDYKRIQTDLASCDEKLIRYGTLSKADVRASTDIGWLRKLMYHFTGYSFRDIHQVCQFGKRLTIQSDPDLETTARISYYDNLERVRQLNAADSFTDEEASIIQEWSSTFVKPSWDDVAWGQGQVSQRLRSKSKWRKIANHYVGPKARYAHLHAIELDDFPVDHWYFQSVPDIGTNVFLDADTIPKGALEFVPKSFKTYRSICMEDLQLVPYQQAVFRAMARWFERSLGDHIDLTDQPRSRRAAYLGSAHPDAYATIDLSMASDSVSYGLVKKWLWNTPLRDCLFSTRSSVACDEGDEEHSEFRLPLFAAMGSAVCFPLECLIFAAIVQAAINEVDGDPVKGLEPSWFVYGDDIVIETAYAPAVIKRLQRNGFIVNTDKSFYTSQCRFREACGGEYYAGQDVTPVRLPRNFRALTETKWPKNVSFGTLTSWIGLCNATMREGLWFTRRYLIQEMTKRIPREYLPWTNDVRTILMEDGASPQRGVTGFGVTQQSSFIFTNGEVTYPYWDPGYQRRYRFTLASRSVRQDYYTTRGHLISALTRSENSDYEFAGDTDDRTSVIISYE